MDIEWANRQLWNGYELGRALPMHIIGLLKQETVGPQLLLPRLGMLSRERIDWLLDAEMGNVRCVECRCMCCVSLGVGVSMLVGVAALAKVLAVQCSV